MGTSHSYRHLTEVSNLLPLETIQVSLNRRTSVLQVLCGEMLRILKLCQLC